VSCGTPVTRELRTSGSFANHQTLQWPDKIGQYAVSPVKAPNAAKQKPLQRSRSVDFEIERLFQQATKRGMNAKLN